MTEDHSKRPDDHLVEPMYHALGEGEAAEERVEDGVGLVVGVVLLGVVLVAVLALFLV